MNIESVAGKAFVKTLAVFGLTSTMLLSAVSHACNTHIGQEFDFSSVTAGQELGCMALNLYHEGRGEGRKGQLAIAAVIMNRVRSERYPDTVCEVVWQRKQFSWTHTASKHHSVNDPKAWRQALGLARSFLENETVTEVGNATHYHAARVRPYWAAEGRLIARVGNHYFYVL